MLQRNNSTQIFLHVGAHPRPKEVQTGTFKTIVKVYNKYVEKTQEISSLEYFTFVRLDCEKLRKVAIT